MSLVNTGRIDSAETRKKKSESMKRRWKNPEYAHMVRSSCQQHPNSLESSILSLLSDLYPNQWKFVGDGSLNIDGLSPDIVHVSRKLLIECNGTYWHQEDESERLSRLESYGYKVLILWDKESRDQWVKKIGDFIL
jgi:very-short-patch-repair endonuclease